MCEKEAQNQSLQSASWVLRHRHRAWDGGEGHARPERAREGRERAGPRWPRLTWEGVVTLISGTNVSSNKLRICSCLTSLDGVCLGGGGTGGPFRSWGSAAGEGAAWKGAAERGGGGDRDKATVSHLPATAPPATKEHRQGKPSPPRHRHGDHKGPWERPRPGGQEPCTERGGSEGKGVRQEKGREQDRKEGKTGLPGCQGHVRGSGSCCPWWGS